MSHAPPQQWPSFTVTSYTADDLKLLQDCVREEMKGDPRGSISRGLNKFGLLLKREIHFGEMFHVWLPLAEKVKDGEDITNPREEINFTVEQSQ